MADRTLSIQRATFALLVAATLVAHWIASGSFGRALGAGLIEIPASIALGRVVLWFGDKLALFGLNMARPDSSRASFDRTLWQTLSISLLIGLPLWLLLSAVQ